MLRILHCVNNMHRAGLETMLMNYYRNIDRERVQFDFLAHREASADYDDEIEALGGRIYRAPRLYPQNYPAYFRYMKQFFLEHPEYSIVHSHIDAMSYLPLFAAKKAGVPVRIAHSHSTGIDLDFKYPLKQIFRHRLGSVATHCFACGIKAGEFLFCGNEYTVIPNAVDAMQFKHDDNVRARKRQELGVSGRLVIGHVGRMCYPKNHEFLLRLFAVLLQKRSDAILLLVGTGEKERELRVKADSLGISSSVMFLGNRSDVRELYQAMDVFVLPSHFEGVPLVGIEAQFAGLPCLFSTGVPVEVSFGESNRFLDLSAPIMTWVNAVLELSAMPRVRENLSCSNYDIRSAATDLRVRYESLLNKGTH